MSLGVAGGGLNSDVRTPHPIRSHTRSHASACRAIHRGHLRTTGFVPVNNQGSIYRTLCVDSTDPIEQIKTRLEARGGACALLAYALKSHSHCAYLTSYAHRARDRARASKAILAREAPQEAPCIAPHAGSARTRRTALPSHERRCQLLPNL